jgi:glycosyltransferase involved in cell wall biosynthesis
MSDRVIALIPAYNEAARIAEVVSKSRPYVAEVIVIDDGSADDTAASAEVAGARVLRHRQNAGKGAAIATALTFFAKSDAQFVIFLDADGQHDPEEIPKFVEAARATDAGIVVGNRMIHTRDMPFVRLLTNRLTSWVTSKLARQNVPDSQCGYRLVRRDVLADLNPSTARFETETEMLIQAGRAGHHIASVNVRTIYGEAARRSHIHPLRDTVRFFKLVAKYW